MRHDQMWIYSVYADAVVYLGILDVPNDRIRDGWSIMTEQGQPTFIGGILVAITAFVAFFLCGYVVSAL